LLEIGSVRNIPASGMAFGDIGDLKKDGVAVVSSRVVAEDFGKEHNVVMRTIRNKIEDSAILHSQSYFIESTYINNQNKEQPPQDWGR